MIKNRFFKTTMGLFAEVIIAARIDNSNAGAQQATYEGFITNAAAGHLGVFWDDTKAAVAAGATALAANAKRKFFYAWKSGDGTVKRSTGIPAGTRVYSSQAYSAGAAQVSTLTAGGTYSLGQTIIVKIIETTGTHLPYPSFDYEAKIGAGGINTAISDIATAINAESSKNSPVVTAGAAANVLTLTAVDKIRTFRIVTELVTTTAQPTDASAPVVATTTKQAYAIGDVASILELEEYATQNQGGVTRTTDGLGIKPEELGLPSSNVDRTGATQYGIVLVSADRSEPGIMETADKRTYTCIAIRTADVATLVAL